MKKGFFGIVQVLLTGGLMMMHLGASTNIMDMVCGDREGVFTWSSSMKRV